MIELVAGRYRDEDGDHADDAARAAWDPQYLLDTLGPLQPKLC